MRRALSLFVIVLAVTACATWTNVPPDIVDGQKVEALQQDFLAAGTRFDVAYTAGTMSEENYHAWREYVRRFQKELPSIHQASEKAAKAGQPLDAATSAKVRALKRELDLMTRGK